MGYVLPVRNGSFFGHSVGILLDREGSASKDRLVDAELGRP